MENQNENVVQPYGIHGKMLTYAYGEKKDRMLYIDEVPNGVKCGCFCPCCGEPLNAHNGGKKLQHHFAHQPGCDCKWYYETTLHKLAKEIISEEKCVMLPKVGILPSELLEFENVEVEKFDRNTGLKPDCTCTTKDGWVLWVEIFVTHQVSEDKVMVIEQNGINCLEINISNQPLDKETLKEFIASSVENRHFINYPYGEEIIRKQNEAEQLENERRRAELREKRLKFWENKHRVLRRVWIQRNRRIEGKKKDKLRQEIINNFKNKHTEKQQVNYIIKEFKIGDWVKHILTGQVYKILWIYDFNGDVKMRPIKPFNSMPFVISKYLINRYYEKCECNLVISDLETYYQEECEKSKQSFDTFKNNCLTTLEEETKEIENFVKCDTTIYYTKMPRFNRFPSAQTLPHSFCVGDVIAHVNSPNDVFFVDSVSGTGYKCFWLVDGEPDCERGIGFLFEDEPFLGRIK